MNKKIKITAVIVLAAIAGVLILKTMQTRSASTIDSVQARSKGVKEAKLQIIEFIDFECPACAYGVQMIKEYMDKHPQDIRVQLKYFPLVKSHVHAMQSALYSECAGRQGKFWPFHELLMPSQKLWSPLISAEAMFRDFAKQAGLDMGQLDVCLASDDAMRAINDDKTLGTSLGVQSTPTYFVNNKMVVGAKSLKEEIDSFFYRQ